MTSQISHAFWRRQHTNNSVKQHYHDILNILKKHNQNYAKIFYLIKKIGIRTGTCFFKFIFFKLTSHVRMDKGRFLKLQIDVVQLKEISRKKPEDFEVIFLQLVVAYPELTVT